MNQRSIKKENMNIKNKGRVFFAQQGPGFVIVMILEKQENKDFHAYSTPPLSRNNILS
jgi:hypothetical protein